MRRFFVALMLSTSIMASVNLANAKTTGRFCVHFTKEFRHDIVKLFIDGKKVFDGMVTTKVPGALDFAKEVCVETKVGDMHDYVVHVNEGKQLGGSFKMTHANLWMLISQSGDGKSTAIIFTPDQPFYD